MSIKQFLTPKELSMRWGNRISPRTLANWRSTQGNGPPYTKIGGAVLYPLDKIVEWESRNTVTCTSQYSGTAA